MCLATAIWSQTDDDDDNDDYYYYLAKAYASELSRMWPCLLGLQLDVFFWIMYWKDLVCVDSLFHVGWTQNYLFFSRKSSTLTHFMRLQGTYHPLLHCHFVADCPLGSHVRGHAWTNTWAHANVWPEEWDRISFIYSRCHTKDPLKVSQIFVLVNTWNFYLNT